MLKTIKTDPNHHVIGHDFTAYGNVYHCESYDPDCGYWMVNKTDSTDRRNVSERAPRRTFIHKINSCSHPDCNQQQEEHKQMNWISITIRDVRSKSGEVTWTERLDQVAKVVVSTETLEAAALETLNRTFEDIQETGYLGYFHYADDIKPSITDLAWAAYDRADNSKGAPIPIVQSINW